MNGTGTRLNTKVLQCMILFAQVSVAKLHIQQHATESQMQMAPLFVEIKTSIFSYKRVFDILQTHT